MIDLTSLSIKQLRQLDKRLGIAIQRYEVNRKEAALADVTARAREYGFSLAELENYSRERARARSKVKYSNPMNRQQNWSGRGRRPLWFSDALCRGMKAEEMEIGSNWYR